MLLSDSIAKMIEEMLDSSQGLLEIGRNELANSIGCVPSQINYVITSRFTPERGYIVESRRGGGGYIKITRVRMDKQQLFMHLLSSVEERIDFNSVSAILRNLSDNSLITEREVLLLLSCLSDKALEQIKPDDRDTLRASIFKNSLVKLYSLH